MSVNMFTIISNLFYWMCMTHSVQSLFAPLPRPAAQNQSINAIISLLRFIGMHFILFLTLEEGQQKFD